MLVNHVIIVLGEAYCTVSSVHATVSCVLICPRITCDSQTFSRYCLPQSLCVFPPVCLELDKQSTACPPHIPSSSFQVSASSLPMTVFVFKSSSSSSSATDLLKFSRLSSGELRRCEEEERSIEKSLAKRVAVKLPAIPPPSGLPACLSLFSLSPSFTCWEREGGRLE